jgi:hypothetical protein
MPNMFAIMTNDMANNLGDFLFAFRNIDYVSNLNSKGHLT